MARAATLFVAVHVLSVAILLRKIDLSQPYPLLTGDYALYFGRALRAVAFETVSGRYWGYNPFTMAGYVSGAVHGVSSLFFSLTAVLLHPIVSVHHTLLALEIVCIVTLPVVIWAFARALSNRSSAVAAFGFAAVIYGRFGFASPPPYLHGILPFQFGCLLSLLSAGIYVRWLTRETYSPAHSGLVALLVAVPPFIHVGTVPLLALFLIPPTIVKFASFDRRRAFVLAIAVGVAVVANLPWTRPLMAFRDWVVDLPHYPEMSPGLLWRLIGPLQPDWFGAVAGFANVAALGFAVVGWSRIRSEDRRLAAIVGIWAGGLALFAFAGSRVGLGPIGPGRYAIALEALILALAGVGAHAVSLATPRAVMVLAILGASTAVVSDVVDVRTGGRRLENRLPAVQSAVVDFLRSDRSGGRALIEVETGNSPHYLDLLPVLTGREILGGSNAGNFLKSRFTVFSATFDGRPGYRPGVFGRTLAEQSEADFASYLRLYNVRTILAWSPEAQSELDRYKSVLSDGGRAGSHRIYRVTTPSSFFIEGSGTIEPSYDRLVIRGASRGRLVISYHWLKTLAAAPPVTLSPRLLAADPVPFIEIDNSSGADTIQIVNAGL